MTYGCLAGLPSSRTKPPRFYRLMNALRRWRERDREDQMLVTQWKAAFGPKPEPVKVIPFLNLRISRSTSRRVA